ncbi:ATP-binding protein [Pontivivens insulae]|uniref:histidine kinase n=1 Tax=Pontivivens insulae TaxID=1639689 RepID=A0A2R8ABK9_9RHOB|nr:ATP-binding protein [Pontivivens insulae]RED11213.1 two-component system cell cycle sensor histidine kinase/response regulator CckA [Pontivivens insulae]SPF29614.1 Sensor kinase CckA [Pontivivens insulae]
MSEYSQHFRGHFAVTRPDIPPSGIWQSVCLNAAGAMMCAAGALLSNVAISVMGAVILGAALLVLLRVLRGERDVDASNTYGETWLTDMSGRFAQGDGRISDALDILLPDGARIGFAMVNALADRNVSLRHVQDHDGRDLILMLERAGSGRLRWRLLDGLDRQGLGAVRLDSATYGHVRIGAGGQIDQLNSWLRARLSQSADVLEDVLMDLPPANGRIHRAAFDPDILLRSLVVPDEAGGCDLLLFPLEEHEVAASNPDQLMAQLPIALARLDTDGVVEMANPAARKLLGDAFDLGTSVPDYLSGLAQPMAQRIQSVVSSRRTARPEVARMRGSDIDRFFQISFSPLRIEGALSILMIASDATELKTLEAQFVQSQKMQAVGQLAGGVAHDFNNLLTALSGHCDLLLLRRGKADPDYADLMQIKQNANRAAALVRQLLAFSRKQTLQPRDLQLAEVLGDLSHLLNRLLTERVGLHIDIGTDLPNVRVDLRQLEQVIMNLVVNARDAMPSGGEVTVSARNVELAEPLQRDRATVEPGRYAVIEVRDNGVGIADRDLNKIFEPFYTTKRPGEGTGLGLSTAYGIIKQTGGFIFVDSVVEEGTTFTLYLPHVEATATGASAIPQIRVVDDVDVQEGKILLVEDEAPVRAFAARALQLRGYEVIEADCGEDALEIVRSGVQIDLIISDVIMPGLDGPSWVAEAREVDAELRVIFMSGYAEDMLDAGVIQEHSSFVAKPFSLNDLTLAVKTALETSVQSADS